MDAAEVVRLYTQEDWTLRRIAAHFETNHHKIKRVLVANGITLARKPNPPMTEEHRRKIGEATKRRTPWSKGRKMTENANRKNMKAKLKTDIDLTRYPDFERLKLLTKLLAKRRAHLGFTDTNRAAFLDRFYFDPQFNAVYDAWIASGKDRWYYPSLDHIHPQANGGTWELDNLRFITWFENRAKADMTLEEWEAFKATTNTRSDLFV